MPKNKDVNLNFLHIYIIFVIIGTIGQNPQFLVKAKSELSSGKLTVKVTISIEFSKILGWFKIKRNRRPIVRTFLVE